jgi:hypothetical protein
MMSSAGVGGDPMAARRDGVFENCLVLAFDAQIDGCLFKFSSWVSPRYWPRVTREMENMEYLLSSWHILIVPSTGRC